MAERLTFTHPTRLIDPPDNPPRSRPQRGGDGPRASDRAGSTPRTPRQRRDWAFIGLMVFTAMLFFRPQDMLPVLAPLRLAELSALGAIGALIFGRLNRGLPLTRTPAELIGVAALGAVIIFTAPFSIWFSGVIGTFMDLYVKVLLIFLLMVNTLTSARRIEQFTWIIVTALGYLAVRAVLDYARGVNMVENGRVRGAIGGIFRNPNDLALNLVSVLPLGVAMALRAGPALRRAFAALCVMFMLAAIVVTQSRGGTLALVVVLAMLGIKLLKTRPALVFAGALALAAAVPLLPASYLDRIASISRPELDDTGSREARRILLREAVAAFVARPLTGVGAGQFKNFNPDGREEAWHESHNVILQVAAELGIFGVGCFGFLVVSGFMAPAQTRKLLRRLRQAEPSAPTRGAPLSEYDRGVLDSHQFAMSSAVAGWFVCAMFGSVAYNWTFYYLLGLAIAPREIVREHLKASGRSLRPARRRRAAPVAV